MEIIIVHFKCGLGKFHLSLVVIGASFVNSYRKEAYAHNISDVSDMVRVSYII